MNPHVEITKADGTFEQHRIEGEQATLGRGPGAAIIVGAAELDPEHMLLAPRPEGCWVSVSEIVSTPVIVNGTRFQNGMLAWGSVLEVGSLRLTLTDKLPPPKTRQKAVSSPIALLMLLIVPIAGYMLLMGEETELPLSPGSAAPPLFDPPPNACSDSGDAAAFNARESIEAAESKGDRYPFDAQDGIQAVRLFDQAAACYAASGDAQSAARARQERAMLADRIEYDFQTHKVRLERALEYKHMADAIVEVEALRRMVKHRDTPYTAWLTVLQRQLQVLLDQGVRSR